MVLTLDLLQVRFWEGQTPKLEGAVGRTKVRKEQLVTRCVDTLMGVVVAAIADSPRRAATGVAASSNFAPPCGLAGRVEGSAP